MSLPTIARATRIPVAELETVIASVPGLARAAKVLSAEELGQKAAQLANRALDEGMRMLDEGTDANKLRLITSLASHPMRRMQTDTSQQFAAMRTLLDTILLGGEVVEFEEDIEEDEDRIP